MIDFILNSMCKSHHSHKKKYEMKKQTLTLFVEIIPLWYTTRKTDKCVQSTTTYFINRFNTCNIFLCFADRASQYNLSN